MFSKFTQYDDDDMRGLQFHEQRHAEAVETLRKSTSGYIVITTDGNEINTLAGFVPGTERSGFTAALATMLWRLYFQACLHANDGIITYMDANEAVAAFCNTGAEVLQMMKEER